MNAQFPTLMSPFTIGNIEVRNRLVDPAHATALSANHRPRLASPPSMRHAQEEASG